MIYLLETKLQDNKPVVLSLQNIYGINKFQSFNILKKLGLSKNIKIKDLSENQIKKLSNLIEFSDVIIASDLKKKNILRLKTLISIKSYRGLRRIKGLPVRGQRTHTNAKTANKIRN